MSVQVEDEVVRKKETWFSRWVVAVTVLRMGCLHRMLPFVCKVPLCAFCGLDVDAFCLLGCLARQLLVFVFVASIVTCTLAFLPHQALISSFCFRSLCLYANTSLDRRVVGTILCILFANVKW